MSLAAGTRLGSYQIQSAIGAGGMGEVYKARDTRLDRTVAIKVLPADVTDPDRRARFEREAKTIAGLNHPHICTLHDVGDHQGSLFLVMELLEGEPLRARLHHSRLDVPAIIDLGVQLTGALESAHAKGIVHRDIKPENIFITPHGAAKLLDFGVAKLMTEQAAATAATSTATRLGTGPVALGTVAYMSPEQVRGEALDARTDLFSLGVVLYEMATGTQPFHGTTSGAVLGEILTKAPTAPVRLNPDVPPELERIVNKLLEKDRALRYQSAADVEVDLRRLERESGRTATPFATEAPRIPSLAVLPFANLSADKENEYFSDGLAEDVIDALTQVKGLRVMARTSSFAFRGKEVDIREIATKLNVEHILEGSVRRSGNRLRVTAQLVKASDGYHLWSQRFDREMTDVFTIQDEISQAIVEKLRVRLAGDRPLVRRHTENLAAYDLCLKARYHLAKLTHEGYEAGQRCIEQAVALDPNFAPTYVLLADSYLWGAWWGSADPRELLPWAKSAALKALSLDDTIAEAHSVLGAVLGAGEFDWPGAERECRRALQLNPSSGDAHYYYAGWCLLALGQLEEALTQIRWGLELNPFDSRYSALVGYCLYATRQFESAIAHLQHAIDLDPTFWYPVWLLSNVYAARGRHDEAIAAAEKARQLCGGSVALTLGLLGRAYAVVGRISEARQLMEELEDRRRSRYVPLTSIAMVHRGLGDYKTSLDLWTRAVEEHDVLLVVTLQAEPGYDAMRSYPAFEALLRKMNLEP